uniref:3-dehydroquinate dehydratase n=1 Tax=Anopheles maculatus TaxID=74869 RepID=A0A182STI9_9DIPT
MLIRCRRMLGLWCFAWATLHLISYSTLELGLSNISLLGRELITRPYLTLGIVSWLFLLALAATSTLWAQRKLAAKWQKLHNFVYLVAILAPIHYLCTMADKFHILLLNGPNLNLLGTREPEKYGSTTLTEIVNGLENQALALNITLSHLQSNAEHALIDRIHQAR